MNMQPLTHLVKLGDETFAPCRNCGATIRHMSREDEFTLDPREVTCEIR